MANSLAELIAQTRAMHSRNLGFAGAQGDLLNEQALQRGNALMPIITNQSLGYTQQGMPMQRQPQGQAIEVFGRKGVIDPFTGVMSGVTPDGQKWTAMAGEDYAAQQEAKKQAMAMKLAEQKLREGDVDIQAKQAALRGEGANKPTFNADAGGYVYPPSPEHPQGRFVPVEGYSKPEKPLTEYQGQSVMFGTRAADAHNLLNSLEEKVNTAGLKTAQAVEGVPLLGAAAHSMLTPEQQRVDQAQRNFVNAVMRRESGATISQGEFENAKRQYFPQVGDDPTTIEQKRRNREMVIKGFARGAGAGAKDINEVSQSNPYAQSKNTATSIDALLEKYK